MIQRPAPAGGGWRRLAPSRGSDQTRPAGDPEDDRTEHYSEAESALDTARLASDRDQAEEAAFWQREAQVHATLALAAATALNQGHAGIFAAAGDAVAAAGGLAGGTTTEVECGSTTNQEEP